MALFEIVLMQSYYNQEVINRWNYLSTSTPATVTLSFGLISAFGGIADSVTHVFPPGSIMEKMAGVQNTQLKYISIIAKNIYDPTDFYTTPFFSGQAGLNTTGEPMSPTMAYGFHSTQVRRDIKGGQKRLSGCNEGLVDAGGVIPTGPTSGFQALADLFSTTLTYTDEGATLTYIPCVVQKEKYTTPSGKNAYRYYPTLDEQVPGHVAQSPIWSTMPQIRTQTSRQYGRGG